MVVLAVELGVAAPHGAAPHGLVGFQPDDGLDFGILGGAEELDGPMHGPMIRERERGLAQLFGFADQVLDAPQPIQQGVFGMGVQMDKVAGHDDFHPAAAGQER